MALYKDINDLKNKCEEYLNNNELWAPRSFRIYLGLEKSTLSKWKINKQEYFNLVKEYEDKILARVEEYAIYGEAHPDIKKAMVVVNKQVKYSSKTGNMTSETYETKLLGKYNTVGALFTLRAYDRELYITEKPQEVVEDKEQIYIEIGNKGTNKLPTLFVDHKEK